MRENSVSGTAAAYAHGVCTHNDWMVPIKWVSLDIRYVDAVLQICLCLADICDYGRVFGGMSSIVG